VEDSRHLGLRASQRGEEGLRVRLGLGQRAASEDQLGEVLGLLSSARR